METTAEKPLATITAQIPTVGPNAQGVNGPGFKVMFDTRNGVQGQVFVPTADVLAGKTNNYVKPLAEALEENHNAPVS